MPNTGSELVVLTWRDAPAWLSLLVSVVALLLSVSAQREANSAQRKIAEIEEQRETERRTETRRARIRPELRNDSAHNFWRLYLVNQGLAEARNVRVSLNGQPLKENSVAIGDLPSLIGAGGEVSCIMAFSMSFGPPFEIQVQWDDDSGNDQMYRMTLTY